MRIRVETAELEQTAAKVEQAENDFQLKKRELYQQVEALSNAWKGKDNLAFVNQIEAYQEDLQKISTILLQYVDFLRHSAQAYRDTQETLQTEANRLRI